MGLRIQHNIAAMNAHRQLGIADSAMGKSLERLSSGYRINKAADDAAGLAISQSFRADIASFKVASRNTSEASSLLQVAEGAMDQIGNMLVRLKELATQAASANSGSNLDKIEAEKGKLVDEIGRIANSTEYADTALLDGSFGEISSTWDATAAADGDVVLDASNNRTYTFTDNGTATPALTFDFSGASALSEQTYTMTSAGGAGVVDLVGGTDSELYHGTISGTTLTFDTIGLTITGASTLTSANLVGDTLAVANPGFSSIDVASTTTTGTWAITDAGSVITLTNGTDTQAISNVTASQTLDFDDLGITLKLGADWSTGDLDGLEFDVDSTGSSTFQVGAENATNNQIDISIGNITTGSSGLNIAGMDFATASGAQSALDTIDSAIDTLSDKRGDIGAYMNRLGYAAANLASTIENVQAAESVIRDVDMAAEMTSFTKNQILLQAGTAMLAQANMAPQQVLALFG